jgi:hypothetical protein
MKIKAVLIMTPIAAISGEMEALVEVPSLGAFEGALEGAPEGAPEGASDGL